MTDKIFEEKTAREPMYQYSGEDAERGYAWRSDVFDYFISKLPAAGPWLKWAEARGMADINDGDAACAMMSGTVMADGVEPTILSHLIWSHLQHCLTGFLMCCDV